MGGGRGEGEGREREGWREERGMGRHMVLL